MTEQNIIKGVTAIIYDKMDKPYFLILKRTKGWEGWEFPKGCIKDGESELDAVKREVIKETGLQKFKIVKKLENIKKEFTDKENILHSHVIYLIEASMNIPINIHANQDSEHSTYLWTDAESTMAKLTWDENKELLKKVLTEI